MAHSHRCVDGALAPGADDLFQGVEHAPDTAGPVSPERALWLSVVARAWSDAFAASLIWIRNSDRTSDPEFERQEARRWLVLDFGTWKADRETACDFAGVDPDILRNAARRKLAKVKQAEAEQRTAAIIALDQAFAALVENSEGMAATKIDAALSALTALEKAA